MTARKLTAGQIRFITKWLSVISCARNMRELLDMYEDDGTNSNVFNNAPRALMCVSVKEQVDLLLRLRELGSLGER